MKFYHVERHIGNRGFMGRSRLTQAVYNAKHRGKKAELDYVVGRMAKKLSKIGRVDYLTSVPRRDSRSNFSLKLARELSKRSGIPYAATRKIRNTAGRVLIIDDVVETGKTSKNTARKLMARRCDVLTATKGIWFETYKPGR